MRLNAVIASTVLVITCLSASAIAGGTITNCRLVEATFKGTFTEDARIRGSVGGDLRGRLDSSAETTIGLDGGLVRLSGKSVIQDQRGSFTTVDEVLLVPTKQKGVFRWMGQHKIVDGDRVFDDAEGSMISDGLLDVDSNELVFTFKALICTR